MPDNVTYNAHIFKYVYYNTLTVTSIDGALILPPVTDNNMFLNLTKKMLLTIQSDNPALTDHSLLELEEYKYLDYPNSTVLSPIAKELFNLIPVIVSMRIYNGKYFIQTKTKEREITFMEYEAIKINKLTTVKFITGGNFILENDDRFYREGLHYNFSIQAFEAMKLGITISEIDELDIDTNNYKYIHVNLPEPLYGLPGFIHNSYTIPSLETFKSRWLNIHAIELILNRDINNVKSHIVRKFIMDIKTNTIILDDGDYNNYDNIELVFNYLSRVWTDELRYRVNEEFPGMITNDFLSIVDFKRFVTLCKVTDPLELISIPDTVSYSKDKEYILNTIFEKLNSN